ncbi:MAG: tRNA 2-thiouridine(34) synthase MnmA [Acidimicrobiia bacterium]|nr:MAG: tRNA 2-thiouridine(34) synthase MnmA [Acidimicrobiia bacterium]
MRALVAMSGGVDSSVAAALMLEQGYDVIGVTLKQWEGPDGSMPTAGCCTLADAEDARRVAAQLDVPYYVLDYVDEFTEAVVDPFASGYLNGLTPNPCIECNRRVRFTALLERTKDLGCDVLVTGHYARVVEHDGVFRLGMAADDTKDQSYVLHMLDQSALSKIRLPVGEMRKTEVRARAAQLGLRTASKPDSQDICFVASGDYRDFLAERHPEVAAPGDVLDMEGTVVGEHQGTAGYTIGQRRGLGVAVGSARYVVDIEPTEQTITIGTYEDLLSDGCFVTEMSFTHEAPAAGDSVSVKVRYRSDPVAADIIAVGDRWEFTFVEPQPRPAPGQSLVMYDGEFVLGGGIIVDGRRSVTAVL